MASFVLQARPPFRLDLTAWVLRRVPINRMDRWDGRSYRRIVAIDGAAVEIEVNQTSSGSAPELHVATRGARIDRKRMEALRSLLEKMLGLNVNLRRFNEIAKKDERLSHLIKDFRGFKPPRLASVFETMVNGIACQQVSLMAGMHFLNRLSANFGLSIDGEHAFPGPEDLAKLSPGRLRPLGFSGNKARTIISVSRAISDGRLDLESLASMDDDTAYARLLELKGIGRWTAQYILLRGLGRLDVFPADDIGGQNKIQRWLGLKTRPDYAALQKILAPWRPYRGLLYFYLLLNEQRRLGLL